nr:IPT/TIG domain-containing protein [Cohnella sp. WQ 127256]
MNGYVYRVVASGLATPAATSNSATLTVNPPPTITSISPTSGPTSGGTSVTLTGTNLTGATAVHFGKVKPLFFQVLHVQNRHF